MIFIKASTKLNVPLFGAVLTTNRSPVVGEIGEDVETWDLVTALIVRLEPLTMVAGLGAPWSDVPASMSWDYRRIAGRS